MKTNDLLKFVIENDVEYHYVDEDVIMMPTLLQTVEFNKLLTVDIFINEEIDCIMRNGYFCFNMNHICDYYGIELFDVFPDDSNR